MKLTEDLMLHLRDKRPTELDELRKAGVKVIGYAPGNYVPEELLYSCGAVPICLFRGGDPEAVAISGAYIPRFIDTFCRSQIGYRVLGEDPYYQMVDLVVCPITDNNQRAIADCWEYYTNVEVFRFGVPHSKEEVAFYYYLEGLRLLKKKLEDFTGTKITDDKLREAITLYNRLRRCLRSISLLRKSAAPPISGKDFVRLNHASYLLDKTLFIDNSEALLEELRQEKAEVRSPRLLLAASTLAFGDYKVLNLVDEAGAAIVIEEVAEGIRYYWEDVSLEGDPLVQLAETYFRKTVPPAYFRPSRERIDFIIELARAFDVDGIVWYQLMYRESYDIQASYFTTIVKDKLGIPVLKLQSDYDVSEVGAFRTRIETFVEMARSRG